MNLILMAISELNNFNMDIMEITSDIDDFYTLKRNTENLFVHTIVYII